MQHPDEGTIHSWLDGELPAEEAASLEAHVATCQSCAAAVAEARGFIAASSRILTALDNVPRGVLPAVPERKRNMRVLWRAAAAMLVVAGGSLVVMREGGPDASVATSTEPLLTTAAPISSPSPEGAPPAIGSGSSLAQSNETASRRPTPPSVPARTDRQSVAPGQDMATSAERRRVRERAGGIAGAVSADAVAPTSTLAEISANTAAPEGEVTLKVLRVASLSGSRQTTYEIAPGQTVTLTEPVPVAASGAAVSSAQEAAQPQIVLRGARTAPPLRLEAAPASPPPPPAMDARAVTDSAKAGQVTATAKGPVAQRKAALSFSDAPRTISWREARTGKTLTLTGNVSVERLQEIRLLIETERAVAGAKSP